MSFAELSAKIELVHNEIMALMAAGDSLAQGRGWELRVERDKLMAQRRMSMVAGK